MQSSLMFGHRVHMRLEPQAAGSRVDIPFVGCIFTVGLLDEAGSYAKKRIFM